AGGGDKATGVDNNHIGLVGVGHTAVALASENAVHALAIDSVLRAAKGDDMVFHSGIVMVVAQRARRLNAFRAARRARHRAVRGRGAADAANNADGRGWARNYPD